MTDGYALIDLKTRDLIRVKGRVVHGTRTPLEHYLEEQNGRHFDSEAFEEVDPSRISIIQVSLDVEVEFPSPKTDNEDPRFLTELL